MRVQEDDGELSEGAGEEAGSDNESSGEENDLTGLNSNHLRSMLGSEVSSPFRTPN